MPCNESQEEEGSQKYWSARQLAKHGNRLAKRQCRGAVLLAAKHPEGEVRFKVANGRKTWRDKVDK